MQALPQDVERVQIVQQVTGCTEAIAQKVITRLAAYDSELPISETNNRFNMSTQSAATLCGVCKSTFLKYAEDHPDELPYVKLGCKFRFSRDDVQAFIHKRINGGK